MPVPILYLPAAQGEHTPPSGPVVPALHEQAVAAELGLGEFELPGHTRQVDSSVAPAVAEYFPAEQSVQTALPVVILYLPAAQDVHVPPSGPVNPTLHVQAVEAVLGPGELELPGHDKQADSTVAPWVPKYFAAAQSVHAALPVLILYLPAAHGEHALPSGPVDPALQVQPAAAEQPVHDAPELAGQAAHIVLNVAPAVGEYFPAAQSVQTALPVASLYLPATHVVHTLPSGPVEPALQVQAVTAVLWLGELEFAGHATQVAIAVTAVVVEYVPVGQLVHAALRMKTFAPLRVIKISFDGWFKYEFCPYNILSVPVPSPWSTTDIQGSSAIPDL
jgi:hypothetical protein